MILSFSQGDNAEMKVLIALNLGLKRLQKAFKLDGGRSEYLALFEAFGDSRESLIANMYFCSIREPMYRYVKLDGVYCHNFLNTCFWPLPDYRLRPRLPSAVVNNLFIFLPFLLPTLLELAELFLCPLSVDRLV